MINVPLAQSIRFRPVNSDLPNFDNTFASDYEGAPYSFDFYVKAESKTIQVVIPDDLVTVSYMILTHNGIDTNIAIKPSSVLGSLRYVNYLLNLGLYEGECCSVKVYEDTIPATGQVLKFESEPFIVETKTTFLNIEWYNSENSFQMNYSSGLTHSMQLEAKKWKLTFGGESSVYINQGQEVKLKGIVQRIFLLECELPDYLAEIMVLAMEHDRFYINEVEFVVSKKPTLTQLGTSGMYSFSAEVKQKLIIGLNTHDVG